MQKINFKLNDRTSIEVEAEKSQDVIRILAFWQSIPSECQICKASLVFDYQTPQTYKYYKIKCTGPESHSANLSERQDLSGMYFDRTKTWTVWRTENPAVAESHAATPTTALTAAEHPNEPFGDRGKLIQRVKAIFDACRDRNIDARNKVNLDSLGRFSDAQLVNAATYLQMILDNPQPKPKPVDPDIPF